MGFGEMEYEASMRLRSTKKGTDEGMFKRRAQRAGKRTMQNNSGCVGGDSIFD
jgi:hypothetical protein